MVDGELLLIIGPPAVGKMTVGRAVCERTDFRLFLNHDTIEPLVRIFGFDHPAFRTLNSEFRHRIVQEAAASARGWCSRWCGTSTSRSRRTG